MEHKVGRVTRDHFVIRRCLDVILTPNLNLSLSISRLRFYKGMVGWCFGLNVLARIFPRLNCYVFFSDIKSRTELISKLVSILLPLKEH